MTGIQGSLRTKATIEKFKAVPVQPGTTSPLLVYFGTLLTRGKLNAFESVELSRMVLSQNKKHLLDNWFKVCIPCSFNLMRRIVVLILHHCINFGTTSIMIVTPQRDDPMES